MRRIYTVIIIFFVLPIQAEWNEERAKIQYLLREVGKLEGAFIRNGKEHTPAQASSHLEMKLERAMNGWFAPDREKWTADMFIEKIASKSSLSGANYKVRLKDGRIVDAGNWLRKKLKQFKKSEPGGA